MIRSLLDKLLGPKLEFPPAASEHDESDWDDKTHNKQLNGVVSKHKRDVIKAIDLRSKVKYDTMDRHITKLREIKDQLKAKKEAKLLAAAQPAG